MSCSEVISFTLSSLITTIPIYKLNIHLQFTDNNTPISINLSLPSYTLTIPGISIPGIPNINLGCNSCGSGGIPLCDMGYENIQFVCGIDCNGNLIYCSIPVPTGFQKCFNELSFTDLRIGSLTLFTLPSFQFKVEADLSLSGSSYNKYEFFEVISITPSTSIQDIFNNDFINQYTIENAIVNSSLTINQFIFNVFGIYDVNLTTPVTVYPFTKSGIDLLDLNGTPHIIRVKSTTNASTGITTLEASVFLGSVTIPIIPLIIEALQVLDTASNSDEFGSIITAFQTIENIVSSVASFYLLICPNPTGGAGVVNLQVKVTLSATPFTYLLSSISQASVEKQLSTYASPFTIPYSQETTYLGLNPLISTINSTILDQFGIGNVSSILNLPNPSTCITDLFNTVQKTSIDFIIPFPVE